MKPHHEYFVYILTNPDRKRKFLYTGITNNIARRLVEHYANRGKSTSFAGKYYCYCLIYIESFQFVRDAIDREKEIKDWNRQKRNELIAEFNPNWKFLNADWCDEWPPRKIWGYYYESLRKGK